MSAEQTSLQLRSLIKKTGELEVSLAQVPVPEPGDAEVVVRVEATPINPSDLGLLFGAAAMNTAEQTGTKEQPVITAKVPDNAMKAMAGRLDEAMPVGNEGAGVVISAGASPQAQALVGKTVAMIGGAMYAQHRLIPAKQCIELAPGITAAQGASCYVNPLTALGMTETMRREGHSALIHTAAASNLGQMLNKICQKDGIDLVNIVRSEKHVKLLEDLGAKYVCNSSEPDFQESLTEALVATGATIAFDAIGGGELPGQILGCMEAALGRTAKEYSRYGSTTHKQVYLYGNLDLKPTTIRRNVGMAWGVGGWLLFPFLNKIGRDDAQKLRDRVQAELTSTFASHYTKEISLRDVLQLSEIAVYNKRATGEKFLINPTKN